MGSRTDIGRRRPLRGAVLAPFLALALTANAQGATVGERAVPIPGSASLGAAPAATPVALDVVLRPRDPAALAAFVGAVSDPTSPSYRDYLRPGEFADRFGPAPQTVAAVESALRRQGLTLEGVSSDRLVIHANSSAAAAERGLHVQLTRVKAPSGRIGLLNRAAPELPDSVAGSVTAIVGLDTQAAAKARYATPAADTGAATATAPAATRGAPTPCAAAVQTATTQTSYTADQLGQAYDLGPLFAAGARGAGVTVALFELATFSPADVAAYQSCYGTSAAVNAVAVDGGPTATDPGHVEAELDIEGVVGVAPGVVVSAYGAPNTTKGTIDAYQRIATDDTAQVVSTSWGNCDPMITPANVSAEATIFAEMAAQGQSMFAASGDDGSADCTSNPHGSTALVTDDPASQPNVTGVGGTSLTGLGSPPDVAPAETVWPSGGGGISSNWAMPAYQASGATPGVINGYTSGQPCNAQAGYCREVPDVSASADPNTGYVVYYTGNETGQSGWQAIGGTSAGAPFWAALIALIDGQGGCSGAPVGFLNPALYRLAGQGLNDITHGNNDLLGTHAGAYPATIGYDMASGIGSPVGAGLARDLCTTPPTAAFGFLPATPTANATVNFDATASTDANPGGSISAFAWSFGDGTAATGATPSHVFASAGVYTVTLRVTSSEGLTASATHQITVSGPPVAAFAAAQAPTSLAVSFTDQSTRAAGGAPITGWAWSFGDGATAANQSPIHAYAAPGTYTAGLTVTAASGLTGTTSRQITVTALPTAAFTHQQSPVSLAVAFADGSTPTPGATLAAWAWSFGDGATASAQSPSHAYANAGSYAVTLTVTDSAGRTATTTSPIAVGALATAPPAPTPPRTPTPTPKRPATPGVSIARAIIASNGVVTFRATLPGKGRLTVLAIVRHPRTTPSIKLLAPGAGHSVFARRTVSTVRAGTTRITLSPLAGARRIKRVHRARAVRLDLLVTFTPATGTPVSRATLGLSLPRH